MKKRHFLLNPVLIFVLAQVAWISLLGIWIYWYVSNYIIFNKVGDKISPQLVKEGTNIFTLVLGLILLVTILVGICMIFVYLNRQIAVTKHYDNFIANVTHELKSPLASIQLYLETLNMREIPRQKEKEFIGLMMQDANRLQNLINSILEIAGLEQKKIAHHFRIYEVEHLIHQLMAETSTQFKLSPDVIRIQGNAPCRCVADRNALKIVFDNLIDNAIKYSVESVVITVAMSIKGSTILIDVSDRGIGISQKNQKKIFKKFHRIYHDRIPNVKGTGLGLYWVKEIIRLHKGKVSVFSEGLDRGTTFRIELPVYQALKRRTLNQLLRLSRKREDHDG